MDVEQPLARALRALQKYDEGAALCGERQLLVDACSLIGAELGLVCTGAHERGVGFAPGEIAHAGQVCPIHEWLVAEDADDDAVPNLKGLR